MACVQSLTVPKYPIIARAARVIGEVRTTIVIPASAGPAEIKLEGPAMLTSALKGPLAEAKFFTQCAGRMVKLVFRFQLSGVESENPQEKLTFSYPNVFVIVSDLTPVQTITTDLR